MQRSLLKTKQKSGQLQGNKYALNKYPNPDIENTMLAWIFHTRMEFMGKMASQDHSGTNFTCSIVDHIAEIYNKYPCFEPMVLNIQARHINYLCYQMHFNIGIWEV